MPTLRISLGVLSVMAATASGCARLDDLWSASTLRRVDGGALPPFGVDGEVVESDVVAADDASVEEPARTDGGAAPTAEARDASADATSDAGPDTRPTITALALRTGVVEAPQSNARWIGYMRAGARVPIVAGPIGNDGCALRRDVPGAGWYQIEGGGFVCVGPFASLTPNVDPRTAARRLLVQARRDAAMPYDYAISRGSGAIYRWLPSEADERETEPERFAPRPSPMSPELVAAAVDAGVVMAPSVAAVAGPIAATTDAGVAVATPVSDGGVRIEDLEGANGSPLLRRLLTGMYVSIDRSVSGSHRNFLHTQAGGYVRPSAVSIYTRAPTFQGVQLDESHHLPVAFVISTNATLYQQQAPTVMAPVGGPLARLRVFYLSSEPVTRVRGEDFYHTTDGFFVRSRNVRVVDPHAPPTDLLPNEQWIDVNLDHQSLVAYEGTRAVYVTVASTGRRNRSDPDANYETVQGGFRIESKHVATTMDGNSANDGPYSIEDVPWVMYFNQSFALHGAFWHNQFGAMHSHGCVNLSPPDAHWIFDWSEPHVPMGWQGAESTVQHPGTRVYVHYDNQALGERGGPEHPPQH